MDASFLMGTIGFALMVGGLLWGLFNIGEYLVRLHHSLEEGTHHDEGSEDEQA